MALTDIKVKTAKPKDKPYKLAEPPRESWRLNFLRKR